MRTRTKIVAIVSVMLTLALLVCLIEYQPDQAPVKLIFVA